MTHKKPPIDTGLPRKSQKKSGTAKGPAIEGFGEIGPGSNRAKSL